MLDLCCPLVLQPLLLLLLPLLLILPLAKPPVLLPAAKDAIPTLLLLTKLLLLPLLLLLLPVLLKFAPATLLLLLATDSMRGRLPLLPLLAPSLAAMFSLILSLFDTGPSPSTATSADDVLDVPLPTIG
uniref:Putative phosphatidylinositol 3-and 4-kinase domain-containing protein n=1 Tax=Anopheles darlingi TaxID=43151 RepID=A0A2M4D3R3_ANODA